MTRHCNLTLIIDWVYTPRYKKTSKQLYTLTLIQNLKWHHWVWSLKLRAPPIAPPSHMQSCVQYCLSCPFGFYNAEHCHQQHKSAILLLFILLTCNYTHALAGLIHISLIPMPRTEEESGFFSKCYGAFFSSFIIVTHSQIVMSLIILIDFQWTIHRAEVLNVLHHIHMTTIIQ